MLKRSYKVTGIILSALLMAIMAAVPGYCLTEEEIFLWTARALKVDANVDKPPVHWVDQSNLQAVFVKNNKASYMRWENKLGSEKAQEVMDQYLSEIVGLFEPKTDSVYVGTFMTPCRREAILAHEFTHYFQQRYKGEVMAWGEDAEATMKLVREMEAYKIEKLFEQTFCTSVGILESDRQ